MNKMIMFGIVGAVMAMSSLAAADTVVDPQTAPLSDAASHGATDGALYQAAKPVPVVEAPKNPYPFKLGMSFDVSVPSGAALGLEARLPSVPWLKFGVAGTYTLAPGVRGNIMIDPIKFPVVPVLNVDLGYQSSFTIPGVSNSPSADFTYVDLNAGLAFGSRDGFRFLLLSGMSYLDGGAHNLQGALGSSAKDLTIADPSFNAWIPNAKLGFQFLF